MLMLRSISWSLLSADEGGRIVYFHLRWRMLREPWNQPRGTEHDDFDVQSFSLMLGKPSGGAVAVGRLHFNSPDEAQVR